MTKDRVVSIDYAIRLSTGEVVESTDVSGPLSYLHGRAQIVPGVERAIEGYEAGRECEIDVGPEDGYGERDPDGIFLVPRAAFPDEEEIDPGMTFSAIRPDGNAVVFQVVRADETLVLVDTNHPLAGKHLRVWVVVRAVRHATRDELFHGHVHDDVTNAPLPA